ncbi:Two-component response regulator yesN [hydrothermal vent metagenome]|uniref:Two-component response regulator yesN n=1 Tax=hydrothermal vent metagenome TaxID=652676 RepID=A0A1W1CM29_9ZZZZ
MKRLKLLYAEDEKSTREQHIIYLKSRYDFEIYEADDGMQALNLYKEHRPDIVLTDITMPKMNGLEFIQEIRKISHHTKIIMLTAHSESQKLLQAFDADVVNYLVKPINRQKLRASIDTAIQTLPKEAKKDENFFYLNENTYFHMQNYDYFVDSVLVELSKSETLLLHLLCKHTNRELGSYDIFVYVWNDFDKEFSKDSVRTLVKKLRQKLPPGILKNTYGGFYRLYLKE